MEKKYYYLIGIVLILLIIAFVMFFPKLNCEAQGGRWGTIGPTSYKECNLPTSDAGKICSDSRECEGACTTQLSKEEENSLREQPLETTGTCTAWMITVGCYSFVDEGFVEHVLCID